MCCGRITDLGTVRLVEQSLQPVGQRVYVRFLYHVEMITRHDMDRQSSLDQVSPPQVFPDPR